MYNVAFGERTSLNSLWSYITDAAQIEPLAIHGENRIGDIPHSHASIEKAKFLLGYDPKMNVKNGLSKSFDWYSKRNNV